MTAIVEELGDELVNRRPPFRDANSAYVILTHCLGVMEYWGGATVAERPVQRDRAAEFTASGDVAGLLRRTEHARRRLREDMVGLDAAAPPVSVRRDPDDPVPYTRPRARCWCTFSRSCSSTSGRWSSPGTPWWPSRRR